MQIWLNTGWSQWNTESKFWVKTGFTDLSQEINHINSVLPKTSFSGVKSEIRKSLLSEFELSTASHTNTVLTQPLQHTAFCTLVVKKCIICVRFPFLHQSYRRPRRNAVKYKQKTNKQSWILVQFLLYHHAYIPFEVQESTWQQEIYSSPRSKRARKARFTVCTAHRYTCTQNIAI